MRGLTILPRHQKVECAVQRCKSPTGYGMKCQKFSGYGVCVKNHVDKCNMLLYTFFCNEWLASILLVFHCVGLFLSVNKDQFCISIVAFKPGNCLNSNVFFSFISYRYEAYCLGKCRITLCFDWVLQCVAHLIGHIPKYASVSAYIRDVLHWLPVSQRILYRISALVWRSVTGLPHLT